MDQYTIDRESLHKKKCPDCGATIHRFMPSDDHHTRYPVCEVCDQWFEKIIDVGYIRCNDAKKEYNRLWNEILQGSKDEVGKLN